MEINITGAERDRILSSAFESLDPPSLRRFPAKYKKQAVVTAKIAELFEPGRDYSEKEVNALLSGVFSDYVLLRRSLVDFGHLSRTSSGGSYMRGAAV